MSQPEDPIQVIQPRHSFYETDEKLTLDIFDKGAIPGQVSIKFEPRAFTYENGASKKLVLQPLKGEIDPDASTIAVGNLKVEVGLVKRVRGRWGALEGDSPDVLAAPTPFPTPSTSFVTQPAPPLRQKNWDNIATSILSSEKEKSLNDDPNVGGDSTVNGFFQQLFQNVDDDAKRAMSKSYTESGGTTLSTNWEEVRAAKVEVKPPQGSEYRRWS